MEQRDNSAPLMEQPTTPAKLNLLSTLVGVFTAPQKAFADIAAAPKWVFPLLLVTLATIVVTYGYVPAIQADSEAKLEEVFSKQQLTPEQAEQAQEMSLRWIQYFAPVMAGVYVVLSSLLTAAMLLFAGNIVLGGNSKFVQLFAIHVWGGLIGLLRSLVALPIALKQTSMKVYFGPALFLDAAGEQGVLFKIAAALDVFVLWRVALLALGFSILYKFSFGKSIAVVGVLYALLITGGILISGLGS